VSSILIVEAFEVSQHGIDQRVALRVSVAQTGGVEAGDITRLSAASRQFAAGTAARPVRSPRLQSTIDASQWPAERAMPWCRSRSIGLSVMWNSPSALKRRAGQEIR
jgi:hypothetical protein